MDLSKCMFLTTYKKDYVKKPIKLEIGTGKEQEFANPINEGFKNYLLFDEANVNPPNEDGELFLEKKPVLGQLKWADVEEHMRKMILTMYKFKSKYKDVGRRYFKDPVNKEILSRRKKTETALTEYQTIYCDAGKDGQYCTDQLCQKQIIIPDDAKIAVTTYTAVYRNPSVYQGGQSHKVLVIIPPNNLETSGAVMMETVSDYNAHIGKLGGLIVKSMYEKVQAAKT